MFDIGNGKNYFDGPERFENKAVFEKVAHKCYLPSNRLFLKLLKNHPELKLAFSITGVFLDQCLEFGEIGEEVLKSFKDLADTGRVEFLAETYYHTLAAIYSEKEFKKQVQKHVRMINKLFGQKPKIFRNTELIYNNDIGRLAKKMHFKGMLVEGWDHFLEGQSPNLLYKMPKDSQREKDFYLLLKNYRLSDDIAFRFSNRSWKEHPLSVEKFINWIHKNYGDCINLFLDYETFGEHQWEDTGIFDFLEHFPEACLKNGICFHNPSEAVGDYEHPVLELSIPHHLSWADMERDLSAWRGNKIQQKSLERIYQLEDKVYRTKNRKLLDIWRKLQTSDHFYYMSTKYWADGDVHTYFSPFETPYDAYISYTNVLNDFENLLNNYLDE